MFHEGSVEEGDAALNALEKGNAPAFALVREVCGRGAQVRAIEEAETLLEALDLQRCLLVTQGSVKVAQRLYERYVEARRQRYETMAKRIDEALEKGQVGLLVIGQEHQVQFPQDVRVFYVAPPALDAINRWLRDHQGPVVAPAEDTIASADGGEAEEGGGMQGDEPGESEAAGTEI